MVEVAQHCLDGAQQRICHMGVMLRQDLKADMFLRDPLDGGRQRTEIVDIARVGEDRCG